MCACAQSSRMLIFQLVRAHLRVWVCVRVWTSLYTCAHVRQGYRGDVFSLARALAVLRERSIAAAEREYPGHRQAGRQAGRRAGRQASRRAGRQAGRQHPLPSARFRFRNFASTGRRASISDDDAARARSIDPHRAAPRFAAANERGTVNRTPVPNAFREI